MCGTACVYKHILSLHHDQLSTGGHESCLHCHHQRILILLNFYTNFNDKCTSKSTKAEALREQEYQQVCMVGGCGHSEDSAWLGPEIVLKSRVFKYKGMYLIEAGSVYA